MQSKLFLMIWKNLDTVGSIGAVVVLWSVLIGILITGPSEQNLQTQNKYLTETQGVIQDVPQEVPTKNPTKIISHVHLTCYHPVKEQCNEDPLTTANGSKIDLKKLKQGELKWCAISRDLEWLFPLGSTIRITDEATGYCYGEYEIRDRMNRRWNHRIDILKHPDDQEIFSKKHIKIELVA